MTVQTEARNATLADLNDILIAQHDAKVDVVAPATTLRSRGGLIHVRGAEAQITDDGVTEIDGIYRPTRIFDEGVSEKLGIPLTYVRKLRETRPDLYDANVNGWLHGRSIQRLDGTVENVADPDPRSFLFRGFTGTDGQPGIARTLLSDSYGMYDHLDVLTAALDGVKSSGVEVTVDQCDLTDRRMYVRVSAPSVAALAPELLKGYRSPYSGASGDTNPTVFAGFVISNSEVGDGAFSITPRLIVQVCTNGMTMSKDAMRAVHLGGKLETGIVKWSPETQRRSLDLVRSKARDAVATFLDIDYVRRSITALETAAGVPVANSAATIQHVSTKLHFTDEQRTGILDHFIRGGQLTAGGVMQAVTSYCQQITDADAAFDLEAKALLAMETAAALR